MMGNEELEVSLLISEGRVENGDRCATSGRNRHRSNPNERDGDSLFRLSGKWELKFRESWTRIAQIPEGASQGQTEYYERQKATIAAYKQVHSIHNQEQVEVDYSSEREPGENMAINASNIGNVLLLVLKVYACVNSKSLAILASTLDSLLDLLAGAILCFTRISMKKFDVYEYPIGKSRVQPVGIICFAAVMATLGLQVLLGASQELINNDKSSLVLTRLQLIWLCGIMGTAVVMKMALFLYCRRFKNRIIQAYSKDHYFDVITNIVGLLAALLAIHFFWWIDPIGAIILALYTIINWFMTILENAVSLIGKVAPPEMIQKLTYLALTHDDKIKRIDTVRAYTFGSYYFAEIDIELPEDMPLKEAHEIGESLQDKIERLPEVERAFVHLDFECEHKPEHSMVLQNSC